MCDAEQKQKLIILTGPTAVGKTGLSIRLAKALNASVISADSMQVYKGMDIGTAKIRPEEMQGIPHYLIDIMEPTEAFNVVRFQQLAKAAIREIRDSGRVPLIAGGTGFYIQSVLYDIDFTEENGDPEFRAELETLADREGSAVLYERLKAVDPRAAEEIHPNNRKRIIRALEFYEKSKARISDHNEAERQKTSPYDFRYFVLNDDREKLYARIEERIDEMLSDGLVDEVKRLRDSGLTRDLVSMQGLGYKEILQWLDGEISYEEAVRILKRDTRRFAKRQLTWFRRERDVIWVNKYDFDYSDDKILEFMLETIRRPRPSSI